MLKRTLNELKNSHGSAIIMALMAAVVLVVLALAIVTLSMGNLGVNQADAMNNDAYYAADSGANSAVEQLKQVVADYYNQMAKADSGTYDTLYNNFFAQIKENAEGSFIPLDFNGSLSPVVTFSNGSFDAGTNVGEFIITSKSTAPDGSKYEVDAKLYVKRLDISQPSWFGFFEQNGQYSDSAYLVGGALTLNSGYGVYNGGDVLVSKLNNPKNQYYYVQPPGTFSIQSGVAQALNDCLVYPSYTDPVLTPTFTVTANNTELNGNTINPATGKKLFTETNAVIVSNPGISFKIGWGCPAKGTIIYKKGTGTLTIACSNTLDTTLKCYSDGDVVSSNGPVFADIYCRGNISTSGNFHGNIICGGSAGEACASFEGSLVCKGSITCSGGLKGSFFAEGPITISNGNQGNNIIYSKTKISMGSGNYQNAVLFSGGDIDINGGSSLTGAIWAKGNVNQNSWLTLNYSKSIVETILKDTGNFFFNGGSSGSTSGGGSTADEDIIVDQKVTPIGRVN